MSLLLHQGGWDEVLMFIVPALLGWWALRWAERRARSRTESERTDAEPSED